MFGQALLQPAHGERQSLRIGGLQDIIDGAVLEGFDGVGVVGSDEDHVALAADIPGRLETGLARHADVEKSQIGMMFGH